MVARLFAFPSRLRLVKYRSLFSLRSGCRCLWRYDGFSPPYGYERKTPRGMNKKSPGVRTSHSPRGMSVCPNALSKSLAEVQVCTGHVLCGIISHGVLSLALMLLFDDTHHTTDRDAFVAFSARDAPGGVSSSFFPFSSVPCLSSFLPLLSTAKPCLSNLTHLIVQLSKRLWTCRINCGTAENMV